MERQPLRVVRHNDPGPTRRRAALDHLLTQRRLVNHQHIQAAAQHAAVAAGGAHPLGRSAVGLIITEQVVPLEVPNGLHDGFQVLAGRAGMVW